MVQVRRGNRQEYKGPEAKIGRSQFDRSHGLKTTFDASRLYPILVDEVLPGDTFTCSLNGFARIFSPLISPVMDNIELETFFFFVPNRLVWDQWVDFQGEHTAAGAQDTTYTIPIMTDLLVDHDEGTDAHALAAHMGLPHGLDSSIVDVSALPFRSYNLIYNEWFRDQNVTDELTVASGNGPDGESAYELWRTNKKHDYFTSCLPYLQKGTAVSFPAYVSTDQLEGFNIGIFSVGEDEARLVATDGAVATVDNLTATATQQMYANININSMRQSVAIQRLLERDARGGTRYVEKIKAHFGVTNPDFRLQRPEYLGGGKSFINVSAVANTSSTVGEDQGELKGVGTGVISGHSWAKSFTEHGHIIGIIRARGDITYFQGLDRMWSRSSIYDFYIPALANIGEQSVLNKELWVSNGAPDDLVFGYQERWAEYRMKHSRVVGNFNPDITGSLGHWHLAQDFPTLPALNTTFMIDQTPMARVVAVTTEPDFLLDLWFNYKCARPLPVYSVPSLTNRF